MALDNAQFMSELSITDPPGTDPLSEGDDQIRTSKRTQLQSFPNVDKAVTTTADELNDVALLSTQNTFTAENTSLNADLIVQDASFRLNQTNTADLVINFQVGGFSRWSLNQRSDAANNDFSIQRRNSAGALIDVPMNIEEANGRVTFLQLLTFQGVLRGNDGSAITPSYSFTVDPSAGMYRAGTNQIGFGINSTQKLLITNSVIRLTDRVEGQTNGSPSAPSYSFTGDSNTGMYRDTTSELKFAAGGVRRMIVKSNTVNLNLPTTDPGVLGDLYAPGGFVQISV